MPNPNIQQLVDDFSRRLIDLINAQTRDAVLAALQGGVQKGGAAARPRRTGPVNPARRLQGQYLGRLRKLKGRDRARVQAVARNEGVAAAVKLAEKLTRK